MAQYHTFKLSLASTRKCSRFYSRFFSEIKARPDAVLSLDELRASEVFTDTALFHRFPCPAVLDADSWKTLPLIGSRSQARAFANKYRRPGAFQSDMCVSEGATLSRGAPPSLWKFSSAWGGISTFVPIGSRGQAAWRYVHEAMSLCLEKSRLPCYVTCDPSASAGEQMKSSMGYIFDRSIGRSWSEFDVSSIVHPDERICYPDDDDLKIPLAHHVLLTTTEPIPVSQIEELALCHRWSPCASLVHLGEATLKDCTIVDGIAIPPPGHAHTIGDVSIDPQNIRDEHLNDVEFLLFHGLVHDDAPIGLCIEALLLTFLFHNHQDYFIGRLDRVFALDGGRGAQLVLAAAERAFPGGDLSGEFWSREVVAPLVVAASKYLVQRAVSNAS